ncbi:MAG: aspartate aminotransferase family protein, partial [Bacteroidetes Order II. Incertae sedis bacterium]|nr:aspartate aminotransferase family protein [Bacteroidetes Order II. bacterium]
MSKTNFHMTADEFRKAGREVVDWIADYYEWVESHPVVPTVAPGDIRASLPEHPPQSGEPFASLMTDVDKLIMPGITH